MRDVSTKADGVGDVLNAGDFNATQNEVENAVTTTGQTLDPAGGPDTPGFKMLSKALAAYGSGADFYQDSGVTNAYVLSRPGTLEIVPAYFGGMACIFKVGNTNSGASTVNVSSLGVKNITTFAGAALQAGDLLGGEYAVIRFNSSADRFEVQIYSGVRALLRLDGIAVGGNSTGDIVTADDSQDLTNKTYEGGSVGANASGDIVTTDDSQDLTNKTYEGGTVGGNSAGDIITTQGVQDILGKVKLSLGQLSNAAIIDILGDLLSETSGQQRIRLKGYSPGFEMLNKTGGTNWHIAYDDDNARVQIGQGYGPGQGITPVIQVLDSTGNVGVNKSPGATYKLDVNGNILASGGKIVGDNGAYHGAQQLNSISTTYTNENGAPVDVSGSLTDITTVDLGTVAIGDVFIANGFIRSSTKGGTAGEVTMYMQKSSGTAAVECGHDNGSSQNSREWDAAKVSDFENMSVFEVTTAGTLIMKLSATSLNSNLSIGTNEGQLRIQWLRRAV